MTPVSRRRDDEKIAETLRQLFPGRYRTDRLCVAFRRGRTSMEQIMVGRSVPRDVRLIVGLLVACPQEYWPPRWIEARKEAAYVPPRWPDGA